MLTESEMPLKFYGSVMLVIASLRDEVQRELDRIGAAGEWFPGVYGIEQYPDRGDVGPTAAVALWSLVLEDPIEVSSLQIWIDARSLPSAD